MAEQRKRDEDTPGEGKGARKVRLPEGYETERQFLEEARKRFQEGVDFDRENRDAALEDLKFAAGEQWDEAAQRARKGRPMLVINRLPQFIAQVVGDLRMNPPAVKVRPAEDADKDLAEVREGLIRAIERGCDAPGVYASTGQSQVTCGIGNHRISLKYASEDGFERDIAIERIPNPFAVVWDPLAIEPTGKDARYCFVVDEWPRETFEKAYPDETPSDLVNVSERAGWTTKDTVRVTEYWRVELEPAELALLPGGRVVEASDLPKGVKPIKTRTAQRRRARMWLITGHAILSGPHEMPIDRVPVLRAQGWEMNVAERRVRFGLVRFAKDPQRLLNYWRSVSAEVLAMAPKGKWLAPAQAVGEDREDDFRRAATSADPLLIYDGGAGAPQWINPPSVPAAVLQEANLNAQDMKDVTGLHDASLGARSNETSGRAIMARQKQGDVATYVYRDNLEAAIAEGGRIINQLIPVVYDTARTIRVIGQDEAIRVQRINDPADPSAIDINRGRYDVVVETGPAYATRRVEAADSMMQFVQAVPAAGAAAPDLIARAMDWPMADVLAERLKKTLPPQMLAGEDGGQGDPAAQQKAQLAAQQAQAQAAAQAQAQQLAQAGAMLDLRVKTAAARKAEAEATRAEAEALVVQAGAGMHPGAPGGAMPGGLAPGGGAAAGSALGPEGR